MLPHGIEVNLLRLAEAVALILANRRTPDRIRQPLLNLTKELKDTLPLCARRDAEAAEAKAVIKTIAYTDLED